ncbi:MAG TPA: RDD family protein [Ktedonobacterales bacterium]|jgi:uncharacterized RDD family membrane protein YckC|nr:RDD family protein [Ktedonobacterales bacterium]
MEHVGVRREAAGFASRTIAFGIDLVLVSVILMVIGLFAQVIGMYFPVNRLLVLAMTPSAAEQARSPIALALAILVYATYSIVCWALLGQTPGKALLGLRVVRANGQRLSVRRSILRYFAYWVSALPLFLGFLWILVDNERQGWHDKIADTYVIYASHPLTTAAPLQRLRQRLPTT